MAHPVVTQREAIVGEGKGQLIALSDRTGPAGAAAMPAWAAAGPEADTPCPGAGAKADQGA